MTTADGKGLCFACRHEWNPGEVTALPDPPQPDPATADFERDVIALTAQVDDDAKTILYDLIGQLATLEGGQLAMVVDVIDVETLAVAIADGRIEHVGINDVDSIVPMPPEIQALMQDPQGDQPTEVASDQYTSPDDRFEAGIADVDRQVRSERDATSGSNR